MDQTIDLNVAVYDVVKKNPEVIDLLVELGFKPLKNPMMLNSIGRTTTIKKGAKLIGLSLDEIKQTLEWNGYIVKDN
ncbi:DUF1858 domain-containing protein [Fundicoccus ignavus]|uniref:DUF1858 domain-containing protein n=1 Tax=Fundicoccus ignavus TaxID=2664442 RepID=A0A844BX74_9LACT|nr:DUF1858 domain-containing protein [Fundicoccus ignavus]MRI82043.1 DUF1858 domain-containing protein [Fundicoccus ignavus]MRJ46649.1 DUF1858 domain-containing protein [Fundicoccus ignavus]